MTLTRADLKKHSVMINSGSGCIFPGDLANHSTYILTAKHLFEGEERDEDGNLQPYATNDGTEITVIQVTHDNGTWREVPMTFTFQRGVTYFPHKEADAAILIVDHLTGFDAIFAEQTFEQEPGYELCGYPENWRAKGEGDKFTSYRVDQFIAPENFCYGAQLVGGNLGQNNIGGMSGGAIMKITGNYISLIGIQSKMASERFPTGQIGFVPIEHFCEIAQYPEYSTSLQPLLPPYLRSFSFLKHEVFDITFGLMNKPKGDVLTRILKSKAIELSGSEITPSSIRDFLTEKLLLIKEQNQAELKKKKIWALWLELMTILNIAKNSAYTPGDFPELFRKVRFFYSDTDSDFWLKHLPDLHRLDYSGLDRNGTVIVASNIPAQDMDRLDLSSIPEDISRISSYRQEFDLEQLQQMGEKIDSGSEFPLEKYQFMNISAFKEGTLPHLSDQFPTQNIATCLNNLKELYARLIFN